LSARAEVQARQIPDELYLKHFGTPTERGRPSSNPQTQQQGSSGALRSRTSRELYQARDCNKLQGLRPRGAMGAIYYPATSRVVRSRSTWHERPPREDRIVLPNVDVDSHQSHTGCSSHEGMHSPGATSAGATIEGDEVLLDQGRPPREVRVITRIRAAPIASVDGRPGTAQAVGREVYYPESGIASNRSDPPLLLHRPTGSLGRSLSDPSRPTRYGALQQGLHDTEQAVWAGQARIVRCLGCCGLLQAPAQYELVCCPTCGVVSPCS
jgi:hypothetical protein